MIPEVESDRHPDLAVVFADAALDARGRRRADLAIEVVSPGPAARRRDFVEKRNDYLLFGLQEYWIVDPERREVTVLERDPTDSSAWTERVFRGDEPIASALLPGLETHVAALWDDADPAG